MKRSLLRHCLFVAALTLLTQNASAQNQVQLVIFSRADRVWEFNIDPARGAIALEPQGKRPDDFYGSVMRARESRDARRREATAQLDEPGKATWAVFSPDCKSVLRGFNGPYDVPYEITYGASRPWVQAGITKLRDSNYINDVAWSSDSRVLMIVETEERTAKNPKALLSAFAGHPVPVNNFYLTTIDLGAGTKRRTKVLADVEYGVAVFTTTEEICAR
ncbi:MAG: hypothetical protein FWC42_11285 [Proteobacteria bacterium]|nr:hypothetical protein [Pseudomonadota bacterium]